MGDRVPWSDRPEAEPRIDLTATLAAGDGGHPEEAKRKKDGVTFKEGAIDFGGDGLFPRVRPFPVPTFGVSREKDNRIDAEAADVKKEEQRRSQAKGDKPFNPIGDAAKKMVDGPEQKSKEQLANEQKITDALERERERAKKEQAGK